MGLFVDVHYDRDEHGKLFAVFVYPELGEEEVFKPGDFIEVQGLDGAFVARYVPERADLPAVLSLVRIENVDSGDGSDIRRVSQGRRIRAAYGKRGFILKSGRWLIAGDLDDVEENGLFQSVGNKRKPAAEQKPENRGDRQRPQGRRESRGQHDVSRRPPRRTYGVDAQASKRSSREEPKQAKAQGQNGQAPKHPASAKKPNKGDQRMTASSRSLAESQRFLKRYLIEAGVNPVIVRWVNLIDPQQEFRWGKGVDDEKYQDPRPRHVFISDATCFTPSGSWTSGRWQVHEATFVVVYERKKHAGEYAPKLTGIYVSYAADVDTLVEVLELGMDVDLQDVKRVIKERSAKPATV